MRRDAPDGPIPRWLRQLEDRLVAIVEPCQRWAVWCEAMLERPPSVAVRALEHIAGAGFAVRSVGGKLALETAMAAMVTGAWPRAHLMQVREAAIAEENRLVTAMLPASDEALDTAAAPLPVPPYSATRPLTLGERKSLAARPSRRLIGLAVADPHPDVIEKLLSNPRLTEEDVLAIATRRPTAGPVLATVAVHPAWRKRERVARALIWNPYTPDFTAVSLVHLLPQRDVRALVGDEKVRDAVRRLAAALCGVSDR